MQITRVEPDPRAADRVLPGWDYGDAFRVVLPVPVAAGPAALTLFRAAPRAARVLRLRDVLVRPLGLAASLGTAGTILPVLAIGDETAVLGMDDRHLDFRVTVTSEALALVVTTLVRRHNLLGRAYFAVVGPFHRRVVPRMLDRSLPFLAREGARQ